MQIHSEAGVGLRERAGSVDNTTGRTVHAACADGVPLATDQDCTQSGEASGESLGIGMSRVVNAFNPARVVLGGGAMEEHPGYVDHVHDNVDERARPRPGPSRTEPSSPGTCPTA